MSGIKKREADHSSFYFMKRLKIAYVALQDASDKNSWSGTVYYIAKTLENHVGAVELIDNLKEKRVISHFLKRGYNRVLYKKAYYPERSEVMARYYAMQVEKRIRNSDYNLILSPGVIPIAFLNTTIPIVVWSDATFSSMVDFYFTNVCDASIKDGNRMEKMALDRCALVFFSSEWAAQSAIYDYGIDPSKVEVLLFGANIENVPQAHEIEKSLSHPLQLLFIGKDWERKGGEVAFHTLQALSTMGVESLLTIVGCVPPKNYRDTRVTIYPFLDKNKIADAQLLVDLYKQTDFLLLPSRRECSGIVLCEANAFGVPVLAADTGGTSTIVRDGVNGFLFSVRAQANDYAEKIADIIEDREYYAHLRRLARARYDEALNWDVAGKRLHHAICTKICTYDRSSRYWMTNHDDRYTISASS